MSESIADKSLTFHTTYGNIAFKALFAILIPGSLYWVELVMEPTVLVLLAITIMVLVILLFWTHIEVAEGGIYLKRGFGILNGNRRFISDESVDYVRVIVTLHIHMLKIVMADNTVRVNIDDLTDSRGFLDVIQQKFADRFETMESTRKFP